MLDKTKFESRNIEFRAVQSEENKMIIEGYAVTYDVPAVHKFGDKILTEVIKRGALDFTNMENVPLRYNHNDNVIVMARTKNRSLQLIKDAAGLLIRAELIDTQSNRDLYTAIKEQLIDKMSFAFSTAPNGDEWREEGSNIYRTITAIDKLYDVSVVDTPFYDSTSIYARSLELLDGFSKGLDDLKLARRKIKLKFGGKI